MENGVDVVKILKVDIGFDAMHSNHLNKIWMYTSKFFNDCLVHNNVPRDFVAGVIRSIIKNK